MTRIEIYRLIAFVGIYLELALICVYYFMAKRWEEKQELADKISKESTQLKKSDHEGKDQQTQGSL